MKNLKNKSKMYTSLVVLLLMFTLNINAQRAEFGLRFMPSYYSFDLQTSTGGNVKGEAKFNFGVGRILGFNLTNHI